MNLIAGETKYLSTARINNVIESQVESTIYQTLAKSTDHQPSFILDIRDLAKNW